MVNRQQILILKKDMDLTFLDKYDNAVQEIAFQLYWEIKNLISSSDNVPISESLNNILGSTLEEYNNALVLNNKLNEEIKQMKSLFRKSDQKTLEYKEQYVKMKKLYADLQKEIDEDDKHNKENIEVIDKLRKEILQMKNKAIESEDNAIPSTSKTDDTQEAEILRLRTSLETMEAAWKVDQENLQKLRKQIEEQPPALGNLQFTQDLNDSVMSFRTSHSTDDTMEGEKTKTPETESLNPEPPVREEIKTSSAVKKILVAGDSHVRDVNYILSSLVPKTCKINCILRPGKTIAQIVDEIDSNRIDPETHIVFFAGTNDVFKTSWDDIKSAIDKLYAKTKNQKATLILIPHRFDTKKINFHIKKLNCLIKNHIKGITNFDFLEPSKYLKPNHYTHDGIHIDRKGKQKLWYRVVSKLFDNNKNTHNVDSNISNTKSRNYIKNNKNGNHHVKLPVRQTYNNYYRSQSSRIPSLLNIPHKKPTNLPHFRNNKPKENIINTHRTTQSNFGYPYPISHQYPNTIYMTPTEYPPLPQPQHGTHLHPMQTSIPYYPTLGSPYPTPGSPYPTSSSPYPTPGSLYPTPGSSYPTPGSLYPTHGSLYPHTQRTYRDALHSNHHGGYNSNFMQTQINPANRNFYKQKTTLA